MKKTEETAIANAMSVFKTLMEEDLDSNSKIAKLDPSARRACETARRDLKEIFDSQRSKINERFARLSDLESAAENTDLQLAFFDSKGNATGLDENGKIIPTQRVDKELERAIDGIHPKDGKQEPIDFKIPSGVPEAVEKGLVQALNDGDGQDKALDKVGKATKTPKLKMEQYWEMLVKRGIIAKHGKHWVAESNPIPAPNSTDPDVLATSETPSRGLVTTTEADAHAA